MAITAQTVRLSERLRAQMVRITDAHDRAAILAWARAWDEVAPDLRDTIETLIRDAEDGYVSRTELLRNARLRRHLAHIADRLDALTTEHRIRVVGDLHALCETAAAAQTAIIASQLPRAQRASTIDLDAWAKADPRQLDAIVRRTTEQITARHYPISDQAYAAVQRELVRGVAAGSNPRQTARRMVARAQDGFNGGLNRADTIARTETLDAYREATALGQRAHADVLDGWQWQASLSSRTCAACLSMNGSTWALTDPGPEGHQRCRCTRLPIVKSWADLGFDVPEPPSVLPSSADYFDGLSAADQQAILGQRGYDAWKRGDWPMSDWARKRSTDGWRDSWVPATPPAGPRGTRSRVA